MGYSQYCSSRRLDNDEAWANFKNDCRQIITESEKLGINIAGPDGTGEPEIEDSYVSFNGRSEEECHDACFIPRDPEHQLRVLQKQSADPLKFWYFCKTARKPYDITVTAVLLMLRHRFGKEALEISSSGGRKGFIDGQKLCFEACGVPPQLPPRLNRAKEEADTLMFLRWVRRVNVFNENDQWIDSKVLFPHLRPMTEEEAQDFVREMFADQPRKRLKSVAVSSKRHLRSVPNPLTPSAHARGTRERC